MCIRDRLDIVYRRGDQYVASALAKLDYFLRDHRTGDVRHFDPRLYDILGDLTASVGRPGGEIDIVCGYRTPVSYTHLDVYKRQQQVNLAHPIPVLILYATVIVTEDGQVHFYDDIYGHDAALEKVLDKGYPYPG